MEKTVVCLASRSPGVLQDFGRIPASQDIGPWRSTFVYRHLSQETRKYIWASLTGQNLLSASEYAGGSAELGQSHPRCTRDLDGHLDCAIRPHTTNTHTWGPWTVGLTLTTTCHTVPCLSSFAHAKCDIIRLRRWNTICYPFIFDVLAESSSPDVVTFQTAPDSYQGSIKGRNIWVLDEVRVKTA